MGVLSTTWTMTLSFGRRSRRMIAAVGFIALLLFTNFKYNPPNVFEFSNSDVHALCTLPEIDPFDEEIMKFDWHPGPISCEDSVSLTFIDGSGFLRVNETGLALRKLSKSDIDCTYSAVERKGDDDIVLKPEEHFLEPEYIQNDFVVVKCRDKTTKIIYENIHVNIDFKTVLGSKIIKNETQEQLSVLIFGIDSLSRNAALRKIPKTMAYIESVLGGITFKGYTKVGGNTFPNIVPLLTGKRADPKELGHIYGPYHFDDYPLVGYNFSKKDYVTLFAEDWPKFSTFNYAAKGFKVPPSDHYIRPLYLTMKKLQPVSSSLDQVFLYLENKSIKLKTSSLCFRNQLKHLLYLEYYKRFIDVYKNKRKFAFTWLNEISHDYSNFLEIADQDFLDFLKWMKDNGHFDKTIMLFMSDHGSRTDEIRNTAAGRIEVRMPLLSIILPGHFKQRYPQLVENMLHNTKVVTTPFDVYALMDDVLHKRFDQDDIHLTQDGKLPRGISLFRNIPKERTCADASVHELFCACFTSKSVNITTAPVLQIAHASVDKLNHILLPIQDKCARLKLARIKDAQLVESNFKRIEESERFTLRSFFTKPGMNKHKYLVLFETSPSGALFEVTASVGGGGDVTITGDIIRTNRYGTQSECIIDHFLRNYCYCV